MRTLDPAALALDAEQAEREVGSTLLWVTVIGMIASLFMSGVFGWKLSGGDPLIAGKAVVVAITIDLLLFRWLSLSAKLRRIGVQTAKGKALDGIAVLMTYYLSILGGISVLIEPRTALAWGLMAVTYPFIPTVMLLSYIAMPEAQLLLQQERDKARDMQDRARREEASRQENEARAIQLQREETQRTANNRAAAEAASRTSEATARTAEAYSSIARTAMLVAWAAFTAGKLDNAQVIEARMRRQVREKMRRDDRRQGGVGHVASTSPARRQPSSPARRQAGAPDDVAPGPADSMSIEQLTALATRDARTLAIARSLGRGGLAKWLAEQAGGGRVTGHKARRVQELIEPGAEVINLLGRTAGGTR